MTGRVYYRTTPLLVSPREEWDNNIRRHHVSAATGFHLSPDKTLEEVTTQKEIYHCSNVTEADSATEPFTIFVLDHRYPPLTPPRPKDGEVAEGTAQADALRKDHGHAEVVVRHH